MLDSFTKAAGSEKNLADKLYVLRGAVSSAEADKFLAAIQLIRSCKIKDEVEPTMCKGGERQHD